ncbi:MAG TPA: hypothetical protein VFT71_03195 [Candidatus Nitrosocosmicus sp.]|nr:hypothetical protein [Candidatus Nitrosocosmicus sp.]
MNRGLKYYGIMLIMIATLVFTLNGFEVVNATIINQNNSTQTNPLNELIFDSSGMSTCDDCASNSDDNNNNNNNNGDESDVNSNDNNRNDNDDGDNNNNNGDDNNNNNGDESGDNNDDVPMSLPFNSNLADESDDEKDYSSEIPFP